MATDFPTKDDDKKVSLRNSNYPQFDYDFIAGVKENDNDIYKAVLVVKVSLKTNSFDQLLFS